MSSDIIPSHILGYFVANQKIGRDELSKKAGISKQEARFYCKLFKTQHSRVHITDVGIAVWDFHHPYHSKSCLTCLLKVIKDIKPSIFILGGDNMDFNTISSYNMKKPKLIEGSRISKDYKMFNLEILTPINKVLGNKCKKYFMKGNHEERLERLVEAEPKLEGLIEIENNLDLHDWSIKGYKEVIKLGHMHFTHGLYWNKYHAHKSVDVYQKNIFYGHVHNPQVYTSISPIDSLPKQGVSVGCMCDLNPEYKKDEPNHWVNQFLVFYLMSDGTFRYDIPTIIYGRTIINGKLYDGN
jgi:hypothetical protein